MPDAYLDHAASTPMRPEAVAAVVEVLERVPGNPSGQHRWAREARRRLDDARDAVAHHLGCRPGEVVFTSGGTEADNLAVTGSVGATGGVPLCLATDHHAVLRPVGAAGGLAVAVGADGSVDLDDLSRRCAELAASGRAVAVVSAALANNEVGTVQPFGALAEVVRRAAPEASIHADAVAATAWIDVADLVAPAGLVSISGHKVGGPKGIGALVVRDGTPLAPILRGGGQEREHRSGTQDVAGAVGMAAALAATAADRAARVPRVETLRDRLLTGLQATIPGLVVTAAGARCVANVAHLCIPGVEREELLFLLDREGVAASAGSSCASGALEPSHVLEAMAVDPHLAGGALRLSLGWNSTDADVDLALDVVPRVVAGLRGHLDRSAAALQAQVCGTARLAIDRLAEGPAALEMGPDRR